MSERDSTCAVEYRPIPGFSSYLVGSDGTTWTSRKSRSGQRTIVVGGVTWTERQNMKTHDGYFRTQMRDDHGKNKTIGVSAAVLLAFVGPRPEGMQCCHNDGNKENNCLENLRWDTHEGNLLDRVRHNMVLCGDRHGSITVSDDMVQTIRNLCAVGFSQRNVAAALDMSQSCVHGIVTGKNRSGTSAHMHAQAVLLPPAERLAWIRGHYGQNGSYAAQDIMWLIEMLDKSAHEQT